MQDQLAGHLYNTCDLVDRSPVWPLADASLEDLQQDHGAARLLHTSLLLVAGQAQERTLKAVSTLESMHSIDHLRTCARCS